MISLVGPPYFTHGAGWKSIDVRGHRDLWDASHMFVEFTQFAVVEMTKPLMP
jgi:hypothetical protein